MQILIVDDHPLFRAGLAALLYELDSAVVTTEAASVQQVRELRDGGGRFDLVLLDLHLPDAQGLEILLLVKEMFEGSLVAIMSATEDPQLIRSAIDAGACGYIPKTTNPAVTVNALRLILARGIYLPLHILEDVERHGFTFAGNATSGQPSLSSRQLTVLQCLLQGKSNKVIARELSIAEGTVKAHLATIYQFMNVTTRSQAMARSHQLGFFEQFERFSQK
jgi:DNA-binding NarL/FixJ family response regulator